MSRKKIVGGFWVIGLVAGFFGVSFAVNQYLSDFNATYGTQATALNSCTLCHTGSPNGNNLNPYADAYVAYGYDFAAVEGLDSDGDGFSNLAEIRGGSFPGDPASVPGVGKSAVSLFDYHAAKKTDVAAFHLPTDQVFINPAGHLPAEPTGSFGQYGWGGQESMPLVWDRNGDGATEISFYHIPTNQWFAQGHPGDNLGQFGWGLTESVPVPGDYNGDGVLVRAFYHTPTNRWFVEGRTPVQIGWNGGECIPLPGDYDGDGRTDLVVYHIPTNQWFMHGVGNLGQYGWNGAESIPVPADYDGDGAAEIAFYHVPTNQWFVKGYPGENMGQYGWGGIQSFPIPGDYNGDGAAERAFYRPAENKWFIEGQGEFIWGWDGANFMPITSQLAVFNWFRFVLLLFQ